MRNILALVATFTLSSTSTMSIMACDPTSERGTTNVFNWSKAFQDTGTNTDSFFQYLLNNPTATWGATLYGDINKYINLSILKNDPKYRNDYYAALTAATSDMNNTIQSLKAKFGRSWEKEWKKTLNGEDPSAYIDNKLKDMALGIIQRSYVTSNYQDYTYYNQNDIIIWLKDIWDNIKNGVFANVKEYYNGKKGIANPGKYASKVWIVANANNLNPTIDDWSQLTTAIQTASSWNNINIDILVAKTKDDIYGQNYLTDSYNTINGLLSDNQSKIAKVMLRNQESIWTRQIVIPFNTNSKPLQEKIDISKFSENETKINDIIKSISNYGFDQTFTEEKGAASADTTKTGDLGLVDITKATTTNSPFYYYLYRYVTSAQGVGKEVNGIQPYNLTKFVPNVVPVDDKSTLVNQLLPYINRSNITATTSSTDGSSPYNDLVYMTDKPGEQLPDASKNNGPGVGIFIDQDGIHFIQTPGITYDQSYNNKPNTNKTTYDRIKSFKNLTNTPKWEDVAPLSERPNGLSDTPYLDYLQTDFLLQTYEKIKTPSFNLNDALTTFTGGSAGQGGLGDPTWWDYNLYFNNNSNLINWNVQSMTGSTPKNANDIQVNNFANKMRAWFVSTRDKRWNDKQGIYVNNTFKNSVVETNTTWDGYTADAPVARMNTNIANYLETVGKQTLWWYDPSIITN